MAGRVRRELGDRLAPQTAVRISGCPNNCAHSAVADVGLVGMRVAGRDAYNVLVGGGSGRDDKLAEPVARRVEPDKVIAEIARRLEGPGGTAAGA